jgi:type VI secretion system protein ImpH
MTAAPPFGPDAPAALEFFQAVRLLERAAPDGAPIGGSGDPAAEPVRFGVPAALAFVRGEVAALERLPDGRARMLVNFIGLTGPRGVLPYHYTEEMARQARLRNGAPQAFLDLFHHRVVSLFYRAWKKHRPAIAYDGVAAEDRLTEHLRDLVGIGTAGLEDRLAPVPDDALLFYAGLLSLPSRPAAALEQLLADYFGVPAAIEQFVGGWYRLEVDDQCALGEEEPSSALGLGAVVGDEVWDQQARIRLRLGPLTRGQYDGFLPGGRAHEPLRSLVRFYVGESLDVEVRLTLARDHVTEWRLGVDRVPVGWASWIRTAAFTRDPDETTVFV